MRKHYNHFQKGAIRNLLICTFCVILSLTSKAQTDYSIVWGLDQNLTGVSDSDNFLPQDLSAVGVTAGDRFSANKYISDGNGGYAYQLKGWSILMATTKYVELAFDVTAMQFNVTSLTLRVRRAESTSVTKFAVRSNLDDFGADIGGEVTIPSNTGVFEEITFPINFEDVDTSSFAIRVYAYGTVGAAPSSLVAFDAITLTGQITNTPLPVNLTYFRAEAYGREAQLSWETSWERNSKEFIVERSGDLKEFIQVGRVAAAGNTTSRRQYSFVDKTPENGANYYKLKMVDQDNSVEYSQVKDVIIRSDVSSVLLSPNPAVSRNLIRIRAYKTDSKDLTLSNSLGQKIPFSAVAGESDYMNLHVQSPLAPGIYILSLKQGELSQHLKILVQ
ncbi:hypothetical protein DYBT9275_04234 [Dyadobacter sp. CECT 9275]|uniref:T9SS type A sorting domain-containing protein n=1 Tax=Dyadobacter helix TaxID=2822344 RepID=A0A916JEW6_9BACT|nr:T9SS type A sorting domain-containing protein [Dyadobacter sp. CECT 9275]CAG5008283.1 hypothetical protein DYBT9275_04234 [Dyadobacter sp. CECT 9275]